MSVFQYEATRELSPGTASLDQVSRTFRLTSFTKAIRSVRNQNTSISGAVESLLLRQENSYRCTTELIEPRSLLDQQIVEFIASVQNAEIFQFDRYGSDAEPDNPVDCILVSASVTAAEIGNKFHRYVFTIRES